MTSRDPQFPWLRPRLIGMDAATIDKVRAYEAHSLPGYDTPAPPPAVRAAVLAATQIVPQLPACEVDEDGPDVGCLTCMDSGQVGVGEWLVPMPCPDCPRSDWTWGHELFDDMEHGK